MCLFIAVYGGKAKSRIMKWRNMADLNNTRDLGLYVHIPFALRNAGIVDFLSAAADESTIEKYISPCK